LKALFRAGALAVVMVFPVHAQPVKGDAAAGRIKSESERCQECHGVDGNGNGESGKFAKLAGQYPDYIVKQIRDFRSGERKHDFMSMMARSLEDADVIDIAAYYAGQDKMRGDSGGNSSGAHALAQKLFASGDPARGMAPCAACHGANGKGNGNAGFPVIGGQEAKYLEKQLLDWKSGERRNSAGAVMSKIARDLNDAEITALVRYLSGL
jgi:cytochrome c553